jgi:hypothetical protein
VGDMEADVMGGGDVSVPYSGGEAAFSRTRNRQAEMREFMAVRCALLMQAVEW